MRDVFHIMNGWRPEDFGRFTNPFRYAPHEAVVQAAGELMSRIAAEPDLSEVFAEGKMLGVLVVGKSVDDNTKRILGHSLGKYAEGSSENSRNNIVGHELKSSEGKSALQIGYLAAFSGNAGGKSLIDGFVPPIFDLGEPGGEYRRREAEITEINHEIKTIQESDKYLALQETVEGLREEGEREISEFKARAALNKLRRDRLRNEASDGDDLSVLTAESQREKADLRRLKQFCADRIAMAERVLKEYEDRIAELKARRSEMSEALQNWIFEQYRVHNAFGEKKSIRELFASHGLVPPGGTGECAAPKLLEYAYRYGFKPLAMGEFWYGRSPDTAVRNHAAFYPSCTSKCGPLLGFMLQGLEVEDTMCGNGPGSESGTDNVSSGRLDAAAGIGVDDTCKADCIKNASCCRAGIEVLYEDGDIIVVNKPAGMLSVPGLAENVISAKEFLSGTWGEILEVHRLDMDTSGVLLFAKNSEAQAKLRAQFETQKVEKTYIAILDSNKELPDEGTIDLPLSPDYDERPRQKVDHAAGKRAVTRYKVLGRKPGRIRMELYPQTGRTHQLRVHCAHHLGLGSPILGDKLYGSPAAPRLYLHARSIRFRHPSDGRPLHFSCPEDF